MEFVHVDDWDMIAFCKVFGGGILVVEMVGRKLMIGQVD